MQIINKWRITIEFGKHFQKYLINVYWDALVFLHTRYSNLYDCLCVCIVHHISKVTQII